MACCKLTCLAGWVSYAFCEAIAPGKRKEWCWKLTCFASGVPCLFKGRMDMRAAFDMLRGPEHMFCQKPPVWGRPTILSPLPGQLIKQCIQRMVSLPVCIRLGLPSFPNLAELQPVQLSGGNGSFLLQGLRVNLRTPNAHATPVAI